MFAGVRNFLNRHKRKFLVSGAVIAGGVVALRYGQRKLIEYQEAKAREFIERTRRTQHFESTERTCNQAIMGLAPNLIDRILRCMDTDPLLEQLRHSPENKIDLWNEVKILAFSRLTALVYACSMLVITLRIQFNLLGGYLYKDTVGGDVLISNEVQQHYVALVQHFLKEGTDELCKLVESKVRQVLVTYDLTQKLTLADTEQIFYSIQMAVNSDARDPNSSIAWFVFPSDVSNINVDELFTKMYTETLDMLESDEISALSSTNVSRGFSIVIDSIADFYAKPVNGMKKNGLKKIVEVTETTQSQPLTNGSTDHAEPSTSTAETVNGFDDHHLVNVNAVTIPLPKLIPIVNGLAKQQFSSNATPPGLSTSLVTLYLISDKIKMLGANVYEVFSQ